MHKRRRRVGASLSLFILGGHWVCLIYSPVPPGCMFTWVHPTPPMVWKELIKHTHTFPNTGLRRASFSFSGWTLHSSDSYTTVIVDDKTAALSSKIRLFVLFYCFNRRVFFSPQSFLSFPLSILVCVSQLNEISIMAFSFLSSLIFRSVCLFLGYYLVSSNSPSHCLLFYWKWIGDLTTKSPELLILTWI